MSAGPQIDWGWSALNELDQLRAEVRQLRVEVAQLANKIDPLPGYTQGRDAVWRNNITGESLYDEQQRTFHELNPDFGK